MSRAGFAEALQLLAESYEDLLDCSLEIRFATGLSIRVLSLAALVEIKERLGRPKDLAVLPVLRATLAETKRKP